MKKQFVLLISLCVLTLHAADISDNESTSEEKEPTVEQVALHYAKQQVLSSYWIERNDPKLDEMPIDCDPEAFAKWVKEQFNLRDQEETISSEVTRWQKHYLATHLRCAEDDETSGSRYPSLFSEQCDEYDAEEKESWLPQMPAYLTGVANVPVRIARGVASVPGTIAAGARRFWNPSDRPELS